LYKDNHISALCHYLNRLFCLTAIIKKCGDKHLNSLQNVKNIYIFTDINRSSTEQRHYKRPINEAKNKVSCLTIKLDKSSHTDVYNRVKGAWTVSLFGQGHRYIHYTTSASSYFSLTIQTLCKDFLSCNDLLTYNNK